MLTETTQSATLKSSRIFSIGTLHCKYGTLVHMLSHNYLVGQLISVSNRCDWLVYSVVRWLIRISTDKECKRWR